MQADVELFRWQYPEGGFEWIEGKAAGFQPAKRLDAAETRFLSEKPMQESAYFHYNPLAEPLLFRKFADTEPTEEGFLKFADAYGDLGVGIVITKETKVDGSKVVRTGDLHRYDPLYRWHSAHSSMRAIVDVLTAIQTRDVATLRTWFRIVDGAAQHTRSEGAVTVAWSWVTIAEKHRKYLWDWATAAKNDDEAILRIAQGWAQYEINQAVSGAGAETTSTVRIVFDVEAQKMVMRVCPTSLLAAMWLQCARVLTLNPTFKACGYCKKWFEQSPDGKRRQAIYCGDRCKVAAYRAKKAVGLATGSKLK